VSRIESGRGFGSTFAAFSECPGCGIGFFSAAVGSLSSLPVGAPVKLTAVAVVADTAGDRAGLVADAPNIKGPGTDDVADMPVENVGSPVDGELVIDTGAAAPNPKEADLLGEDVDVDAGVDVPKSDPPNPGDVPSDVVGVDNENTEGVAAGVV
jgi:hypothetical protein